MHKRLPQAQMLPNTDTIRALASHGTHKDLPRPGMTSQDHHDRHPARALPDGVRRQELPAVSSADQSWIIASVLSRRPEEMRSHLARKPGMHSIRRRTRIHHTRDVSTRPP
jgi:hypothetical protein